MLDQPTEVSLCKDGLIYHTANDNNESADTLARERGKSTVSSEEALLDRSDPMFYSFSSFPWRFG